MASGFFGTTVAPWEPTPNERNDEDWQEYAKGTNYQPNQMVGYKLGQLGAGLFNKALGRKPKETPEDITRKVEQGLRDLTARLMELSPGLTPQEAAQKAATTMMQQSSQYDGSTRGLVQSTIFQSMTKSKDLPGPEEEAKKPVPMIEVWTDKDNKKRLVNKRDEAAAQKAWNDGFMPPENDDHIWADAANGQKGFQQRYVKTPAGYQPEYTIDGKPMLRDMTSRQVVETRDLNYQGLETKGARDDEAIEITNKSIGLKNFIDTSKKIEELTAAAPTALHTAGAISKFADNVRATVSSLVTAYGGTIEEIDPNRFSESTLAAIDRSNFGSAMKKAGMDAARIRALFIDLAYASAQEREPGGRGFNEQDLQRALATVGADITSPEAAIQVLRDGREMAIGKYMNYMRMKQVGDKPAIDDPRFQNQLNLVNRSRWPKADPIGTIKNGMKYIGGNPRDPLSWPEVK